MTLNEALGFVTEIESKDLSPYHYEAVQILVHELQKKEKTISLLSELAQDLQAKLHNILFTK